MKRACAVFPASASMLAYPSPLITTACQPKRPSACLPKAPTPRSAVLTSLASSDIERLMYRCPQNWSENGAQGVSIMPTRTFTSWVVSTSNQTFLR